jgi:starch-binding outer membrane protein, SusD/RagB family
MRLYISIACLILISVSSCNKVLNVTSPNAVDDATVFTSVNGLLNARIGMYSTLQDKNYYGGSFPLISECYTDNGTTGGYDVIDLNEIAARAVTPPNLYVQNIYLAVYHCIYTANKIIENINSVPNLPADQQANILGEALFVRALCEFDLLRLYGQHWDKTSAYGISIVTNTDSVKSSVPRSTVDQSYKQILSDVNQSIGLLNAYNGNQYISPAAGNALLARVSLYYKDYPTAITAAGLVIADNTFALFPTGEVTKIYTDRLTPESIFELEFDQQNQSAYNALTYARVDALRSDVNFIASQNLNDFFLSRPDDTRGVLVDTVNEDPSIQPDGRSQKYRGESAKDNSGFILRLAEMYLIRAEAAGRTVGLADLNTLRTNRGLTALLPTDVPDDSTYINEILDERRAELNFEGARLYDLARVYNGNVGLVLGTGVQPIMPIPQREISATNNVVIQNPGY